MAPLVPTSLRLVESFLNSIDLESGRDDLDSPVRFRGWLIANGFPAAADSVTAGDISFARELRDALRAEVREHIDAERLSPAPQAYRPARQPFAPGPQAFGPAPRSFGPASQAFGLAPQPVGLSPHARLNALAAGVALRAAFTPDGLGVHAAENGVRGVLGEVLGAVVTADRDGRWQRLKICRETHCQVAFYDRSKNSSRCWCSMSVCGNRNKTRAYRGRRRLEAQAALQASQAGVQAGVAVSVPGR